MDKGQLTGAIFIDLRKAFDTLSHSLIISKLPEYGIIGVEREWFTNYLFARQQCVSLNGERSWSSTRINSRPFIIYHAF